MVDTVQSQELAVEQAERAWMDAAFRKDLAACEPFLADEFTMVTSRGSHIDKAQWLHNMGQRVGGDEPLSWLIIHLELLRAMPSVLARPSERVDYSVGDHPPSPRCASVQ